MKKRQEAGSRKQEAGIAATCHVPPASRLLFPEESFMSSGDALKRRKTVSVFSPGSKTN
jgi:hypothetical protein